jgi:nucleoside-triphosphatase THEP1
VKSTPSARSTDDPVPILILSGPRGIGKSSLLNEAISDVSARYPEGIPAIRGVVSRGVHNTDGARTGFDAYLFPSRRSVPLARVRHLERMRRPERELSDDSSRGYTLAASPGSIPADIETCTLGPFVFFRTAFVAVGDEVLRGNTPGVPGASSAAGTPGISDASATPGVPGRGDTPDDPADSGGVQARVVVLDEIGPLELRRFDGFYRILSRMIPTRIALLLTVRPDLLQPLEELCRTPGHRTVHSVTIAPDAHRAAVLRKIITFIEKEII